MARPTETQVVKCCVPVSLAEKLERLSSRSGRSLDWIFQQALAAWADQEEERSSMTQVDLVEVELGRVIDHDTVEAWADSLSSETPLRESR
ncbi:CopG family transcriptional regulator [Pseudomonas sp. ATCC 13867]|uniref:CopG family ribbon-helix-helix protein n=1 Tax=Pseudomonas sp. ATCC 13867 TaxID=1294143 RepID=UPI0002C4EF3D|nr:CopG family transcriptional regulator [Pseudomonas sp. ATCC 13867]AGI21908.1 CopG family transcriptional regulator [Pseudomonas sp. ATCC 13867]RFQ27586.1 CopG family transcriptional regulator [Pseudomonas sp. ATCC 13867]